MADIDIKAAVADIESTSDLLERALKLSGLVTTLFQRHGFPLVVVGGSAVEFYTEGGLPPALRPVANFRRCWEGRLEGRQLSELASAAGKAISSGHCGISWNCERGESQ